MSLNRTLLAAAAAALLTSGAAMAHQPVALTDSQMDDVTAGSLIGTGSNNGVVAEMIALGGLDEMFKAARKQTEWIKTGPLGGASASAEAAAKAAVKAMLGGIQLGLRASSWRSLP